MIGKIKQFIKNMYYKKGFKTSEKFVVFESDDWGAIRSTNEGISYLRQNMPEFKLDGFQSVDCLESEKDLELLYQTLECVMDCENNHPVITANFIMQNPTFIDGEICFENFSDTYIKYGYDSLNFIKNNVYRNVFYPQLHGLIHFNYQKHLNMQILNPVKFECFKRGMVGLDTGRYVGCDTFNIKDKDNNYGENIEKAVEIFKETFGYSPQSFVFPCYVFTDKNEKMIIKADIRFLQCQLIQNIPYGENNKEYKSKLHYFGEVTKNNLLISLRNCYFEPINYLNKDKCVEDCLDQIRVAFKNKKPAVICTHRANFVGGISKDNRDQNLAKFEMLLKQIVLKYPDVKFLTSVELFNRIDGRR